MCLKVTARPALAVSFVIVLCALSGCKKEAPAAARPAAAQPAATAVQNVHGATITADPNPVPADEGMGTTTIKYNTGDGTYGEVYLQAYDQPETLFTKGASGSKEVSWINNKGKYTFILYAGKEHKQVLASVTVTR